MEDKLWTGGPWEQENPQWPAPPRVVVPPVRPQTEPAPAEAEEASPAAEDDYPEGDPFAADPVDEPTRRINLNDLKFGRNYSGGDD